MTRGKQRVGLSRLQAGVVAFLAGLAGLLGLFAFTYAIPPAPDALPFVFLLLFVAVSGLVSPVTFVLDARLRRPRGRPHVWQPLRQGLWLGLWATLCAWLQWVHLLNWMTALLFLVIIMLLEWFIISRA